MKEQTTPSSFKSATKSSSGRQATSKDSPGLVKVSAIGTKYPTPVSEHQFCFIFRLVTFPSLAELTLAGKGCTRARGQSLSTAGEPESHRPPVPDPPAWAAAPGEQQGWIQPRAKV